MKTLIKTISSIFFIIILGTISNAQCIIADFPFLENANDISGNNNNGTIYGATLTTDRVGNENSAYYLDGVNDYIDLSQMANEYRENMSSLTVSFWVNFEDNTSSEFGKAMISLGSHGEGLSSNAFQFELENNQIQVETETGSEGTNHEFYLDTPLEINKWFYLTCVFDNDTIRYYRDAELISIINYTMAETNSDDLFIGGFACGTSSASCFFNGKIDDVKIFKCALSDQEIEDLYNSNAQCIISDLPFIENANDISGNNNNGIVHGATLTSDRFGNENSAYYFDGVDDNISINNNLLPQEDSERTFSVWFKIKSLNFGDNLGSQMGAIFNYGTFVNSQRFGVLVGGNNSAHPGSLYFVGQYNDFWCNGTYNDNSWHQLVVRYDSYNLDIFVDNTIIETKQITLNTQSYNLIIGQTIYNNTGQFEFFNGYIDDFKAFNCALSDEEIENLYNQPEQCIIADFPFLGNANDVSGNDYNGIINGATLTTDRFGNENSAYYFNGINNKIKTYQVDEPNFDLTDSLSISAWVKFETNNTPFAAIVSKEEYGGYGLCANYAGTGKLYFSTHSNGEYHSVLSDFVPQLDIWYFLTGTYKTTTDGYEIMKFYVNGELQGTETISGGGYITNTDVPLTIGANPQPNSNDNKFFHGSIDDVIISRCVLSQEEIDNLYNEIETDEECITFKPNSEEGKDARVHSLGTWTSGNSTLFKADAWTWDGTNGLERSFMDFNFSQIPSGVTITNAELSLYDPADTHVSNYHYNDNGSNSAILQRITSSWDENTISWENQPASTNINEVSLDEINQEHQDLIDINVTQLVQDIIDNPSSSFGFLIKLQTETKYRSMSFASSDHPDLTKHPKLKVCYSNPTIRIEKNTIPSEYVFKIFPNPSKEIVFIDGNTKILNIKIFDISGKLLFQEIENSNKTEINISNLPEAIYFISIKTKNSTIIKKLVKQK